jgi:hypothetical protein
MTAIKTLQAELKEARELVKLYTKLGETYMATGNRDLAYAKRREAIAQLGRARSIEIALKQKGQEVGN